MVRALNSVAKKNHETWNTSLCLLQSPRCRDDCRPFTDPKASGVRREVLNGAKGKDVALGKTAHRRPFLKLL